MAVMRVRLLPALLVALALGGCAGTPDAPVTPAASGADGATTVEYLPGRAADVHLPSVEAGSAVPVVLLVPGGGWLTAERDGLTPLAEELAGAGMVAVNATYRAGADGAVFPAPVDDVRCAAAFAVAAAEDAGLVADRLVVLGHSAGGHLAALAALTPTPADAPAEPCGYPAAAPDALVGLAGVYDTAPAEFLMIDFFGVPRADDPARWAAGDPVELVRSGQVPDDLPVLLLHGDADDEVELAQSQTFEAALAQAGSDVRLDVLPGVTHATAYTAPVAAAPVIAWIEGLG